MDYENFKFKDENGKWKNLIVEKYWWMAKETINSFLMLHNDFDFSYLFIQKDMEFIKRTFKLEDLSS